MKKLPQRKKTDRHHPWSARSEQDVLADLQVLCTQPGYVHAVAYLCFRDNMLIYTEHVTEEEMQARFNPSRLLRTEVNTLLGLMIKAQIDWELPVPAVLQEYIEASDRLLQELHDALSGAFSLEEALAALKRGEQVNPFDSGAAMREPIFYSAESAYNFQYVDLAPQRYAADASWLQAIYGFTIAQACDVAEAADGVLMDRFPRTMESMRRLTPERWTMLPAFCLTPRRNRSSVRTGAGAGRTHPARICGAGGRYQLPVFRIAGLQSDHGYAASAAPHGRISLAAELRVGRSHL